MTFGPLILSLSPLPPIQVLTPRQPSTQCLLLPGGAAPLLSRRAAGCSSPLPPQVAMRHPKRAVQRGPMSEFLPLYSGNPMVLIRGPNFDFVQVRTYVPTAEKVLIICACAVHFIQFAMFALEKWNLCS